MRIAIPLFLSLAALSGCGSSPDENMTDAEKKAYVKRKFDEKLATEGDRASRDQIRAECALELRSGEQCAAADASLKAELDKAANGK